MIELLVLGGPVNILLCIFYLVVMLIALERSLYFFKIRGRYSSFISELLPALKTMPKELSQLQNYKNTPFYTLALTYISTVSISIPKQKNRLKTTGESLVHNMEFSLWILGLMGLIAPLLGLLGTMTGLIRSFRAIESAQGSMNITILAGGIWEAMITTVMGLIVAIIAYSVYKICDRHIEKKAAQMTQLVRELNSHFERS